MKKKANTGYVWSFIHVFNQPNDSLLDAFFSQGTIKAQFWPELLKGLYTKKFLW